MTTPDDTKDQTPQERLQISAEDFVAIWKGEKEPEEKMRAHIFFGINADDEKEVQFIKVNVIGVIKIDGKQRLPNILIWESSIKGFSFLNSSSANLQITFDSVIDFFEVTNSSFKSVTIEESKIGIALFFKSSIQNFALKKANLIDLIISCVKKEKVSLINSKLSFLTITDNSKLKIFESSGAKVNNILVADSSIGEIKLTSKTIVQKLEIRANSKIEKLRIYLNSQIGKLAISSSFFKKIIFRNAGFIGHFHCRFLVDQATQLIFKNTRFGKLDFEDTVFPEFTTLSASDCSANELSFRNTCNYGSLFFSNLKSLEKWEDFKKDKYNRPIFENGEFQFEEKSSPSTLRFIDSDLGKVQFINSDLRQFKKFEFLNTKMLDVFVAGSQMPDDTQFQLPKGSHANISEQKRLAYGQFKRIYENQGDTAGSLRYLAQEMDAYRAQMSSFKSSTKKERLDNWSERFILFMNRHSTYYGNNWLRGVAVTISVTIVCFSGYLYLINYRPASPFIWENWKEFFRLYSYSPHYLNPFRDLDSIALIKEEDQSSFARLWDLFSRIIIAYFVYQTIQAFRKLGKSSG